MKTRITELLGIEYPVVQGAMARIADGGLAGAVSEAGGLGIIACGGARPEWIREQVARARALTSKPIGINVMLMDPRAGEVAELVCELGVEDIMVVAHTNCGAQHMSGAAMIDSMRRLGVSDERIEFARHCGIDFDRWLAGFGDTEEAVRKSVDMVANHPVMPPHVRVAGFVMDSVTGELVPVA